MDALRALLLDTRPEALLTVALLKATMTLAIAQLLIAALPRLSAATRHLVLTTALLTFLLFPAAALLAPRWNVIAFDAPAATPSITNATDAATPTLTPSLAPQVSRTTPPQAQKFTISPLVIAAIVWVSITLLLLFRLVVSAQRVRGIVARSSEASARLLDLLDEAQIRSGIERPVALHLSTEIAVPMMWGVRRGTLLLPAQAESWSDDEVRASFIHELGHLQRLDSLSLLLINVVTFLLWFHPQVWTARRRALIEGERACDDLVLRAGEAAAQYASHLLQVARLMPRRDSLTTLSAMTRPSQLEGRMIAILSTSVNRQAIGGKTLMIRMSLLAVAVLPAAFVQLTMQPAIAAPIQAATMLAAPSADDARDARYDHTMSNVGEGDTCADYRDSFGRETKTFSAEESLTYSGRAMNITAARNGGVTLRKSTTGSFTVLVCKSVGALDASAAAPRLASIRAQERGGNLTVDGPDGGSWVAHLIVGVPDGSSVEAHGQNGPVSVRGVDGRVSADVVNGPLAITDTRGSVKARSTNGPLTVNGVDGDLDGAVQNGPLTVTLDERDAGRGEIRLSVENGPLALSVPRGYPAAVNVKTTGAGPFACSLAECRSSRSQDDDNPGNWRPRNITIGSGSPRVFITGGNGPVSINERD